MEKFGSKQGLDETDEMHVELLCLLFVEPFKVGQGQDEDLFGVFLCPVMNHPENSLTIAAKWEFIKHLESSLLLYFFL